jgi:hypothetical protein
MLASSTQDLPEGYAPIADDAADSMAPYEALRPSTTAIDG